MAADKQISAASRRRTRLSGWVLSQFQVTLAVCGIVVGFLVCFGVGFLSGVWFQTQEQMTPHDDAITLADDQLERERKTLSAPARAPSERQMTFYSTLTSRDGGAVPKPQRPAAVAPPSAQPPKPEAVEPDKAETDQPEAIRTARLPSAESLSEPPVAIASPQRPNPEEAAPKPEAPAASGTREERFYSVQVGSFRKVEQAYRLQDQLIKKGYQARIGLSIVQGKGAWYRVRVGRYADRGAANKTAQRLQKREKIDVLVMRVSS